MKKPGKSAISRPLSFLFLASFILPGQTLNLGAPPKLQHSRIQKAQPPAPANTGNWYDTSDRAAVRDSWKLVMAPDPPVPMNWSGDVARGIAGTTSRDWKDAIANRINWFRGMAGVPANITIDPSFSERAQQAAMMFSANQQIDHASPAWLHYTDDGADAAQHSNTCYLYGANDPGCISGYMMDSGLNNSAAGHRRWLLYPQTQKMGTGDVPQAESYPYSNALWVLDDQPSGPRPATRAPYVAWPPPGYVPYQVAGPRWSFSYPDADFTNATVTMTRNGSSVPLRLEPVQNGFGENTIVWVPDHLDTLSLMPQATPVTADVTSEVTVSGVVIDGQMQSFSYAVTVFDPAIEAPAGNPSTRAPRSGSAGITKGNAAPITAQSAAPCSYIVAPPAASMPSTGGNGVFLLLPTPTDCPVSYTHSPELSVGQPAGLDVFLIFSYSVTPNLTGVGRKLTVQVADKTFTVNQAGTGSGSLNPPITTATDAKVGIFRSSSWILDSNGSYSYEPSDLFRSFGLPGDQPVAGDWTGNGQVRIGVFRSGLWYLDLNNNGQWDGEAGGDGIFAFGLPGDIPVIGDWNGDGRTKLGIFRCPPAGVCTWAVDYAGKFGYDPATVRFYSYGLPGDLPVVNNWTGTSHVDQIGVYRPMPGNLALWIVDSNGSGVWEPSDAVYQFGLNSDLPVVGNWNNGTRKRIGVFRGGTWILDSNGNGAYDATDQVVLFGLPGDKPVVGNW